MTASTPLISVIVPTYNQAEYLPICLDALWFQDYPLLEIIVVNAASPDDTSAVLAQYQEQVETEQVSFAARYDQETDTVERDRHARYPKQGRTLRVVELQEDPGLSETYNTGAQIAEGAYITTVVSDDIPHPQMISTLAHALDDGADFAYSDELIVDDSGRILRQFTFPDFSIKECLADWYLLGNSKLWRRSLHEQHGYFKPEFPLTQDYELFARFALGGARFEHVKKVLYSVRFHGEDRKTGNHTPEREPKIHEESKQVALFVRRKLGLD